MKKVKTKKDSGKDDESILEQILFVIKNCIHTIEFDISRPKIEEVDYLKKLVVQNLVSLRKVICQNSNIIFSSGYMEDGSKKKEIQSQKRGKDV